MMRALLPLLLVLATYRTTRLLVRDEFPPIRAIREWVIGTFAGADIHGNLVDNRWGPIGRSLAYLWTCPWCMSVWAGAGVVALADWCLSVPWPWLIITAGSAITGWVSAFETAYEKRLEQLDLQITAAKAQLRRIGEPT